MKHTRGPWKVLDHYEPNRILVDSGNYPNSTPVCEVISAADTKRANAHLIAAAPEMLEVLIRLQAYHTGIEHHDSILARLLNEIIKKAKGTADHATINQAPI